MQIVSEYRIFRVAHQSDSATYGAVGKSSFLLRIGSDIVSTDFGQSWSWSAVTGGL